MGKTMTDLTIFSEMMNQRQHSHYSYENVAFSGHLLLLDFRCCLAIQFKISRLIVMTLSSNEHNFLIHICETLNEQQAAAEQLW